MKSYGELKILKDILIEEWNEEGFSKEDAIELFEVSTGKSLSVKLKNDLITVFLDWNQFGIANFVQIEKGNWLCFGYEPKDSEKYVEKFILDRFRSDFCD